MGNCPSEFDDDSEPSALPMEIVRSLQSRGGLAVAPHCRAFDNQGQRLSDDYEVEGTVLGQGLCGDVLLLHSKGADRGNFAMKTILKRLPSSSHPACASTGRPELPAEVDIFLALDHPNIARLHGIYHTNSTVSFVMDCCEGGELYNRLQTVGTFKDEDAAEASRQMLRAVGYLHSLGIVHRDLKLENFLYKSKDARAPLKLIDFGFAHVWDPSTLMRAPCGSLSYVSPDVLLGTGYTDKCDLWSLGVIIWMLLCGYPPFHGEEQQVLSQIKAGTPDWSHQRRWKPVSEKAVDLVKKLLETVPEKRSSAQGALQHCWLVESRPRHNIAGA